MSQIPSDKRRRLAAKRMNERLRLAANFLNAIGIGIVGAAFIVPGMTDLSTVRWSWIPVGIILHSVAQLLLQLLQAED